MIIEIAQTRYVQVDLLDALAGLICWDYYITTGVFAEKHYLAEKDDVFLVILQETLNTDGSQQMSTLAYLECSDLTVLPRKHDVLEFIKNNQHKLINYADVWEFE